MKRRFRVGKPERFFLEKLSVYQSRRGGEINKTDFLSFEKEENVSYSRRIWAHVSI